MASPTKAKRVLTLALLQALATFVERPFELRQPPALQEPETPARLQQLSVDIGQRTLDGGMSGSVSQAHRQAPPRLGRWRWNRHSHSQA